MTPPFLEDRAVEIDFSASCVIDTASEPGSYADSFRFPPFADDRPLHATELDDA